MIDKIRQTIESHLALLDEDFPTAWENVNFSPPDAPFQVVDLLFAEPDDAGYKDSIYIQRGYLQVGLFYPTNEGPGASDAKARELREYFYRGLSLDSGAGFSVVFDRTPEIRGGTIEEGRFVNRVRCRFYAQIDPTV